MVRYVQQRYGTDVNRTFVTGASSGGMMTNVLIGAYPDVFKAGAAFMGVPFACFATTDGSMWNTQCANGQRIMTPQQWGDLVRNAFPGFTGARPRMQIFHGTADTTLQFPNFGEQIKQWTNVHGLSQTPSFTDTPQPGWTRTRYGGTGLMSPVEAIRLEGVGHSLPLGGQARMAIEFFGLNMPPTSTTTSRPPTTVTTTTTSRPPTTTSRPPTTTTSQPPPGCRVTYTVNPWSTGLTANISIANTGTATINGWSLVFTLPGGQTITSGWNAVYSPLSGTVTAQNMSYNSSIPPGGSQSIGFNASHTGNSGRPASFALNGTPCQVA